MQLKVSPVSCSRVVQWFYSCTPPAQDLALRLTRENFSGSAIGLVLNILSFLITSYDPRCSDILKWSLENLSC